MSNKYCVDCKHFKPDLWCRSPNNKIDLVTGKPEVKLVAFNRIANYGKCGPKGKLFEPKNLQLETNPQTDILTKFVIKLKNFYESKFG